MYCAFIHNGLGTKVEKSHFPTFIFTVSSDDKMRTKYVVTMINNKAAQFCDTAVSLIDMQSIGILFTCSPKTTGNQ